jgi:hypothetical protein
MTFARMAFWSNGDQSKKSDALVVRVNILQQIAHYWKDLQI